MKKYILMIGVMIAQQSFSQNAIPASPCSSNPVYRQFDFWIGEWEAFNTQGKKSGDSRIERILDSCVILENWTSTQAGYAGKSYNTFNAATGKWQQYWVDNKGGITEYFDGRFVNGEMILQTANTKQSDGSYKILKMTFTKLNDNTVRQHGESSVDEGKTWKTDFDLEYKRKNNKLKTIIIMIYENAISWFEIPATDLDRAQKFYESIFDFSMIPMDMASLKMRMFPIENMMGVGGALVDSGGFHVPSSTDGPLIYLNANPDVQNILDKIEAAGGKIIVPKTEISPEYGHMAVFIDTEGNRIALHSVPSA